MTASHQHARREALLSRTAAGSGWQTRESLEMSRVVGLLEIIRTWFLEVDPDFLLWFHVSLGSLFDGDGAIAHFSLD